MRVVHSRILKTVGVSDRHPGNTRHERIPVVTVLATDIVITEGEQAIRLLATQCLIMLTQTELGRRHLKRRWSDQPGEATTRAKRGSTDRGWGHQHHPVSDSHAIVSAAVASLND